MKVILSRKGFDTSNGGIVSPIFEDGTMISFPIPSHDADTYSDLQYRGIPYTEILTDLKYKGGSFCHVDPDLDQERRVAKIDGWEPAFGQIGASASYLKNVGISPGDLFLFFGNFHCVTRSAEHFRYMKHTGNFYQDHDLPVIWGYLQIGKIVDDPEEQEKLWWHPHSCEERIGSKTNVVFKATERLSFDESLPGAGLLPFHLNRVLTAAGSSKATWKKNPVYEPSNVMSNRKNQAKDPNTGIFYAGIWQELALEESDECERWARSVVLGE